MLAIQLYPAVAVLSPFFAEATSSSELAAPEMQRGEKDLQSLVFPPELPPKPLDFPLFPATEPLQLFLLVRFNGLAGLRLQAEQRLFVDILGCLAPPLHATATPFSSCRGGKRMKLMTKYQNVIIIKQPLMSQSNLVSYF